MRGPEDAASAAAGAIAAGRARADGSPGAVAHGWTAAASWPASCLSVAAVIAAMLPIYLLGFGRNFGYDESVTVGNFIHTASPLDALTRQIVNNNHPLLSFLDHVVFSASGNDSEVVMRVIPLVAALAAIAILTVACARRFGAIAGLSAGAYLASNPTFALWAQSVRGYTLLLLCAIASAALLLQRADALWKGLAYMTAVAAGVATNIFMVPVVVCEAAYLGARRQLSGRWCLRMLAGVSTEWPFPSCPSSAWRSTIVGGSSLRASRSPSSISTSRVSPPRRSFRWCCSRATATAVIGAWSRPCSRCSR